MDRPLLGLAIVSMCLYLLDLHGLMGSSRAVYLLVNLLIDSIFVVDLVLKLRAQGMTYVRTPWFLIDLLSCLPLIDVLANSIPGVRAARFARGFRILRILRGLRVLRALRTIPAFDEFFDEAPTGESTRKFHRAMNLAMIAMTAMVLVTIVAVRRQMTRRVPAADRRRDRGAPDRRTSEGAGREPAAPRPRELSSSGTCAWTAAMERAYFDLSPVDRRSNEIEFFLILGMLFSMILFMYILAYHQLDVTQEQLRALLSLALPRQVAERFLVDPTAYDKKARMPATIVFMDFEDFTETCERLAHAPDRALGAHGAGDGAARRRVEQAGHDPGQVHRRRGHELPGRPARRGRTGRACVSRREGVPGLHPGAEGARRPLFLAREDRRRLGGRLPDRLVRHQPAALVHRPGGRGEPGRPPGARQRPVRHPEPLLRRRPAASAPTGRTSSGGAGDGSASWARPSRSRSSRPSTPPRWAIRHSWRRFTTPWRPSKAGTSRGPRRASGGPTPSARGATVPAGAIAKWCESLLSSGLPDGWEPVFQAHK